MSAPVESLAGRYFGQVADLMQATDLLALQRVVDLLLAARDRGASVFIIGNGGSAATASHLATDLANMPKRAGGTPLRVFSLNDNSAYLTALGNDEGYERVFASPLENYVRPGDVLLTISASGNSPNLLEAVRTAKALGACTVALVGFDGGRLREMADECLFVASDIGAYGPVEDMHLMLSHILATCVSAA